MTLQTHALFDGDTFVGEVLPDDLNTYPDADLVPLPEEYWSPERCYAWQGRTAVEDLDALRERVWAKAKALRDQAEWGGCETPLGVVDTDPASQRKVNGAVLMALIAQGSDEDFSVDWTMHDNSTATHDGSAMIAMGVAVGEHVAACHGVGLDKRAAIDAADDAGAIASVDIETGWPS